MIRAAPVLRAASSVRSSSVRFSCVGGATDWTTNTSAARQTDGTWTARQSFANRVSATGCSRHPRSRQTSAARSGVRRSPEDDGLGHESPTRLSRAEQDYGAGGPGGPAGTTATPSSACAPVPPDPRAADEEGSDPCPHSCDTPPPSACPEVIGRPEAVAPRVERGPCRHVPQRAGDDPPLRGARQRFEHAAPQAGRGHPSGEFRHIRFHHPERHGRRTVAPRSPAAAEFQGW